MNAPLADQMRPQTIDEVVGQSLSLIHIFATKSTAHSAELLLFWERESVQMCIRDRKSTG